MDINQIIEQIKEIKALISPSDCYMSIKTLSKYSDLSERKLRELIHHPLYPLPSYKIDGSIRIKKSEFASWLKKFKSLPEKSPNIDSLIDDVMKDFHKS
jgi:hypothetical protein